MDGSGKVGGFKFGQGGDAAQHNGERQGHEQNRGAGDEQPGQQRVAGHTAHLGHECKRRKMEQRSGGQGWVRGGGEKPAAEAHKGHDQRQLERHGGVVGGLDGGQIQTQREGHAGAEDGWNADQGDAADGESERQRRARRGGEIPCRSQRATVRLIEAGVTGILTPPLLMPNISAAMTNVMAGR